MQLKNSLCFDVGGMGIKIIKFDNDSNIIEEYYLEHNLKMKNIPLKLILEKIDLFIIKNNEIVNIGICFPGIINYNENKIITESFLIDLDNIDIKKYYIKNKLVKDIIIENDAKAAAFGEFNKSKINDNDSAFVMTIGSAIGGAAIIGGKVYEGSNGFAGEISKMYVNIEDNVEYVAAHTCSILVLQKKYCELKKINIESISGKTIMNDFENQEKYAISCIDELLNSIARLIWNINIILDVKTFLIGGGISNSKIFVELLGEKVEKYFIKQNMIQFIPKIMNCSLNNQAGCYGLMYMIRRKINGINK